MQFEEHFKSIPAFGRNFEIGDLYNYATDDIIKGIRILLFNVTHLYILVIKRNLVM